MTYVLTKLNFIYTPTMNRTVQQTIWILKQTYLRLCEFETLNSSKTRKIMLHVFKHKVKTGRHSRCNQSFKLYNIRMIKLLQYQNLSSHKLNILRL
ncbi:hypothetical protein Hanom_Chr09g00832551 [Helianthus anomalus]